MTFLGAFASVEIACSARPAVADMMSMVRVLRVLLFGCLLAGCAASPPQGEPSCCTTPAPGTARLHLGGQVGATVGSWH
jgi:hypothetical protein